MIINKELRIIDFKLSHLAAVMRVERASFGDGAYGPALFQRLWRRPGALFRVALRARRVRGYVLAAMEGKTGEIVSLAVHPDSRGEGIGAALLADALEALAQQGARHTELAVRRDNDAAIRFYRRFGFRKTAHLPRYYEDGADAWVMKR